MSRQERLVFVAETFKCFQLAGQILDAVLVMSYILWYDSDGVAGYQDIVLFFVIKGEGKNSIQVF